MSLKYQQEKEEVAFRLAEKTADSLAVLTGGLSKFPPQDPDLAMAYHMLLGILTRITHSWDVERTVVDTWFARAGLNYDEVVAHR